MIAARNKPTVHEKDLSGKPGKFRYEFCHAPPARPALKINSINMPVRYYDASANEWFSDFDRIALTPCGRKGLSAPSQSRQTVVPGGEHVTILAFLNKDAQQSRVARSARSRCPAANTFSTDFGNSRRLNCLASAISGDDCQAGRASRIPGARLDGGICCHNNSNRGAGRAAWRDIWTASRGQMPIPAACTGPDGQMLYAWDHGQHHLELEIFPHKDAEFFYKDRQTRELWGEDYKVGDPLPYDAIKKFKFFT